MVGIGSTIGFQMSGTPFPVVARASTHILVGLLGAQLLKKDVSYVKVALITAPLHGLAEALVIIPLLGFNANSYIVAVGTMFHHCVDVIAYPVVKALAKTGRKNLKRYKINIKHILKRIIKNGGSMINKDKIIEYLEDNDLAEIGNQSREDLLVLRFFYDFDRDELAAAKAMPMMNVKMRQNLKTGMRNTFCHI